MDYRQLIRQHLERGADMTIAFKRMRHDERFGYARLDPNGRVLEYEEKPKGPRGDLASLTVYVINTAPLERILRSLVGRPLHRVG